MFVRTAMGLVFLFAPAPVLAGSVNVPADISVHLSAEPSSGLVTGQPITLTMSVTNHGPNRANTLEISSSEFTNEFNLAMAHTDCQGLGLVVANGGSASYYYYTWWVTINNALEAGETRSCHLILPLSSSAPSIWTFSFYLPAFFIDTNPANNASAVTLRRALGATTPIPIPALSPIVLVLLVGLLAMIAKWAMARQVAIRLLEDSFWR